MRSDLTVLLDLLKSSQEFRENIPNWSIEPAKNAQWVPFPDGIYPDLLQALRFQGIESLYSHQLLAMEKINEQKNIVITTGTASGKSLCYQIPILDSLLKTNLTKALLLFPTKALANDQANSFHQFKETISRSVDLKMNPIVTAVYDGDTPTSSRSVIRDQANILLTNPDMLHVGILPHHTIWAKFLENLKFVVIDEVHIYRGVFGSHLANIIRRLNRILDFYGAHPQYIMTSATIANPQEHAQRLTGLDVDLIEADGSPHGKKNFIFYSPPIINDELGIRQGLVSTTLDFSQEILKRKIQTLLFSRSRHTVELIVHELRKLYPQLSTSVRGYRSGYLKSDRREIEQGLKSGQVTLAVATNALELGIDIGGVDLVLLAGYPGTITSTRQRAGRAGRKNNESAAILIASANPLDQFLCHHPEYLLERSPEMALIDPDNPLILIQQIQCAAFELPFLKGDSFGSLDWPQLAEYLEVLEVQGTILRKFDRFFWLSESYPTSSISLRSTATRAISLQLNSEEGKRIIGEVDYASSLWMTHPGAVYLHEGEPYLVESLDLENNIALLNSALPSYFTEPIKSQEIQIIRDMDVLQDQVSEIHFSEIEVTTRIESFKKIDWETRTILAIEPLSLPETVLHTFGYWIMPKPETVEKMRAEKMWLSDPNEYGPNWEKQRTLARQRDLFRCRMCGLPEDGKPHHVHHKIPFRMFSSAELANQLDNLITLCPGCHRLAEINVRIRSAISGLKYSLYHLAPLLVMCDENDIGSYADPAADFAARQPVILLYDAIPAGMGLTQTLFKQHQNLLSNANDLIRDCGCMDGCPSCVGPVSESGIGGKKETKFLLELLIGKRILNGIAL